MEKTNTDYQKKFLTIPNMLSFFRLCLIPLIIWFYCFKDNYMLTLLTVVISGATDIADGMIARHFGMISDIGKILDPVADKLTQMSILICLITQFPYMLIPLVILIIKEVCAIVTGLMAIHKTNEVFGAEWHGKITTVSLYVVMAIHIVWFQIPDMVSYVLVGICTGLMLMSFVLYMIHNIKLIKGNY